MFMLGDAPVQIVGYTNVKRAISLTCQDIYEILNHNIEIAERSGITGFLRTSLSENNNYWA